jgi:bifunctional non-homologous end joining protein LigD
LTAKLFLAAKRGGQLVYVGSVGTGFSNRNVDGLLSHLSAIERTLPPVATADAEKARWVEPVTAAEIEFRGWTTHKNLRHASYKGLRGDCETVEIFEMPE